MSNARIRNTVIALCVLLLIVPHLFECMQPRDMDERPVICNVFKFIGDRTLVPYHFKYPTLYSYLITPVVAANGLYLWETGQIASPSEIALFDLLHPRQVRWPARFISACALIVTALIVAIVMFRKWGLLAGAVAGAYLLATPWLLRYSGQALPDITAMLFVAVALLGALRLLALNQAAMLKWHAAGAGVFAGLAASTKYNAGVAIVPVLVAVVWISYKLKLSAVRTSVSISAPCVGALIAFLVGSPGWLLAPDQFMAGLQYEARHAAVGHLGAFGIPLLGQFELLVRNGLSLTIVSLLALTMFAVKHRSREEGWVVASLIVATLMVAIQSTKQSPQYLFPLAPACAIFAGLFFRWQQRTWPRRHLFYAVVAFLCFPLVISWNMSLKNFRPNTTVRAREWIKKNIQPDETIAFDWAYVPRFFRHHIEVSSDESRLFKAAPHLVEQIRRQEPKYRLRSIPKAEYSTEWLESTDARYIVTSSGCYERFFRYGVFTKLPPPPTSSLYDEFYRRKSFYEALFSIPRWQLVADIDTGNGPRTLVFHRSETVKKQK